jgi:fructuronate reductase/mannitol 2-dehydrogenase
MVDRITPRTTDADRAFVAERFGVIDLWPVMTEPFSQWMVEDAFCNGRPPLDEVGVRFVDDVRPYALLKTRLLNAGHCALAYLGAQAGYERADEAVADPLFAAFLQTLMEAEVAPLLPPVPGVDVADYRATTFERLRNPKLADRLDRLGRNGSGKVPRHVVSSIAAARAQGREHALLTLSVAAWIRHLRGGRGAGRIPLDDPLASVLQPLALAARTDVRPLLAERSLFGELGDDEGFVAELTAALRDLDEVGVRTALRARIAGEQPVAA